MNDSRTTQLELTEESTETNHVLVEFRLKHLPVNDPRQQRFHLKLSP